jgi:hypothetical protein
MARDVPPAEAAAEAIVLIFAPRLAANMADAPDALTERTHPVVELDA